MKLLLDTHLLLWAVGSPERLSHQARALFADPSIVFVFSVVSLWEVAIKRQGRRDDLVADPRLVRRELLDHGYEELPLSGDHVAAVVDLPSIHRDPFDRILVAQAMAEGIELVTSDNTLVEYPGPIRKV